MRDEERELWERYRPGDHQAIEALLLHYMGFVHYWANYVAGIGPWADRDDLVQEGRIILVKVMEKFDLNKGKEFTAYARRWLREGLLDYLQSTRDISDYRYRQCRKVKKAQEDLMRMLDRKPTIAEIAEEAELTQQQVEKALNVLAISQAEELTADDSDLPMSIVTVENPETIMLMNESRLKLDELLLKLDELRLKLSERERWILTEYYDLGRTDPKIAAQRGLKPDTVKMIRRRALQKLAKLIEADGRWAL